MKIPTRALNAVSSGELQRRWTAVRAKMSTAGVDALIIQNSSDWVGGYIRWFSNQPATNGYPSSLVFSLQNGMSLIEQGPFGGVRVSAPDEAKRSGIARRLTTPSYPSVGYSGMAGALPIVVNHSTIGAIGVSGAAGTPFGHADEVCAAAGLDRIRDRLK